VTSVTTVLTLSNMLQGCSNKSDLHSHDIIILLSPCVIHLVTFLLYIITVSDILEQPSNKSDNAIKLVPNLLQQLGTSSANTTCRQLVNRFVTNLFAVPFKGDVHSVLRISSAHNKGGPPDINIAQILHLSNFYELKRRVYIHSQAWRSRKVLDIQLVYHILQI
jgi:hypothetical protein